MITAQVRLWVLATITVLLVGNVYSQNLNFWVATNGTDTQGCGLTINTPCNTIVYTLGQIQSQVLDNNVTVSLLPGVYNGTSNSNFSIPTLSKPTLKISFISTGNAQGVTIDGMGQYPIITGFSAHTLLQGISFVNGLSISGGCISSTDNPFEITITSCIFNNCSATNGGALYVVSIASTSLQITSGTNFTNNVATDNGGAVYLNIQGDVPPNIVSCGFTGNRAGMAGGAIYGQAQLFMTGTSIRYNNGKNGGGIYLSRHSNTSGCISTVQHCRYGRWFICQPA